MSEEKELSIQETAHKRLHSLFKNDRKKMFPFLKIALGRNVRSSKELLTLSEEEAKGFLKLLNFFVKELDDSYQLNEVKGEMHRNFLWSCSDKEQLRILYFMRKGKETGDIARLLKVSNVWVSELQFRMLAQGAALGKFSHIEPFTERYSREDADARESLQKTYSENLDLFAAKLSYAKSTWDRRLCFHLAAYYAREMLAKKMFGGNYENEELAL